jgi:sRNA-binding carbon storage regulator CsrA
MLVLTIRDGEAFHLFHQDGTETKVTLHSIRGRKVRVGIDCPRSTSIAREKVADVVKSLHDAKRKP